MRFAFIGGTYRGFELLKELIRIDAKPVTAYILKEDDHENEVYSTDIARLLDENGISHSCKKKLAAIDYEKLKSFELDFIFVCGWRTIIDFSINQYLGLGMFAAHDSLLPKYRGFAPINWAMINGESETGVTLFRINEGEVDSGNIYGQRKVPISFSDYGWDVYKKITHATIELYVEFIEKFKNNKLESYSQDESLATYTCKRSPQDGKINWNLTSVEIYNFCRALAHPYPGGFCNFENKTFHIRKVSLGKNNGKNFVGCIPGRVISILENGIEVLCKSGTIFIEEWEEKQEGIIEIPSSRIKSITSTLT